jgi:hypothetical protein
MKTLIEEAHAVAQVLLRIQRKLRLPSNRDNMHQILFRLRWRKTSDPDAYRILDTTERLLAQAHLLRAGAVIDFPPGRRFSRQDRVASELAVVEQASRLTGVPQLASEDAPFG